MKNTSSHVHNDTTSDREMEAAAAAVKKNVQFLICWENIIWNVAQASERAYMISAVCGYA